MTAQSRNRFLLVQNNAQCVCASHISQDKCSVWRPPQQTGNSGDWLLLFCISDCYATWMSMSSVRFIVTRVIRRWMLLIIPVICMTRFRVRLQRLIHTSAVTVNHAISARDGIIVVIRLGVCMLENVRLRQ